MTAYNVYYVKLYIVPRTVNVRNRLLFQSETEIRSHYHLKIRRRPYSYIIFLVIPPSTTKSWPVTNDASNEAK